MPRASWTLGEAVSDVADDGSVTVSTPLLDGGQPSCSIEWTLNANRQLTVIAVVEPGAPPVDFIGAWVKGG
jgi:hypothetical protein